MTMNVFFDVDYTILSSDYNLRRGTADTFQRLVADGHEVYVWSGEGKRHSVVRDFDLEPYVSGVYEKPIFDYVRRLEFFGIECVPDFVIDDYPEIVSVFGGYRVRDFYLKSVDDDEMEQIYDTICEVAAQGWSSNRNWRPRHVEFERMLSGEYRGRP
jgi:hypothetical protein